jgi:hypothetical protein
LGGHVVQDDIDQAGNTLRLGLERHRAGFDALDARHQAFDDRSGGISDPFPALPASRQRGLSAGRRSFSDRSAICQGRAARSQPRAKGLGIFHKEAVC